MKLEEMKRIAQSRTEGEFFMDDEQIGISPPDGEPLPLSIADEYFIEMVSNNWNKMIAVIEAAQAILPYYRERVRNSIQTGYGYNPYEATLDALEKAFEALEKP